MPSPTKQTKEERQRNADGLCACGCDKPLRMEMGWSGRRSPWSTLDCRDRVPEPTQAQIDDLDEVCVCGCGGYRRSVQYTGIWSADNRHACSQRAYRKRRKSGRVVTRRDRRRTAELAVAAQLEQEAGWADTSARSYAQQAKEKKAQARAIRARWAADDAGQLDLTQKAADRG